jgi:hypothetical protein
MSKMGNLRLDAEENAQYFLRKAFIKIYGHGSGEIWDQENENMEEKGEKTNTLPRVRQEK